MHYLKRFQSYIRIALNPFRTVNPSSRSNRLQPWLPDLRESSRINNPSPDSLLNTLKVNTFYIVLIIAAGWVLYFAIRHRDELFSGGSKRRSEFHNSTLVSTLLGLNDSNLGELLELYREEFGPGPARYARRTLKKWRAGEVQPATQTFERFFLHLPKVMSYDLKCEILRHFMEEYAAKDSYELDVHTDDWQEKLDPLVRQIIDKAFTANLPAEIETKLNWLVEGDMQAARVILRASQAAEGRLMVSMLHEEFESLEKLMGEKHLKPRVTHVLEFPYGTIKMNVKRRVAKNG